MLIPPYHFSIVSSPLVYRPDQAGATEVLYRGSIPAERNIPFIRLKRIKTVLYLRSDEVPSVDPLVQWAREEGIELRWVKAEVMGEEKLGMGKNEVGEVIKTILDRSKYPLYIADVDGISHTTLVVACLRKLQGWHMDSILDEICRFEADHEDYSIVPFITSYLSSPDASFTLPPPPYPSWLWPTSLQPTASSSIQPATRRERDRTRSEPVTLSPKPLLPFPHPLAARKHPTMRLIYPANQGSANVSPLLPAIPNNALSRVSTRAEKDERERTSPMLLGSPGSPGTLGSPAISGVSGATIEGPDLGSPSLPPRGKAVNFSRTSTLEPILSIQGVMDSPETMPMSRNNTITSSVNTSSDSAEGEAVMSPEEADEEYADEVEDDDMEDEEEDEEDEEDEDEDLQPQSQYISALDLAGT